MFRGVFKTYPACKEPGWEVFNPSPGILLQVCLPAAQPPAFLAEASQPVISYHVSDLQKAVTKAKQQGAVILQAPTKNCSDFSFCYLQLTDGKVLGFFE
jgi:hypothetical protein